ncbi:MAG: PASTA domain-containing protein [Bacteroidales bacterium]|nr:PASTA domain-containing protein [Bacteroidales bacterium]
MSGKKTTKIGIILKQIIYAIIIIIVATIILSIIAKRYTRHGEEVKIPDLINMSYDEILECDLPDMFRFEVIDSIYVPHYDAGIVVAQNPQPETNAKQGRKIYLTLTSASPGIVEMPNLVNLSLRQAVSKLQTSGLILGELSFERSFDKNAVLRQMYQGVVITPGTELTKGSAIDVVVAAGLDNAMAVVPDLYGKTPADVRVLLYNSLLNVGKEHFDGVSTHRDSTYAYKSNPAWCLDSDCPVELGTRVDVYYSTNKKYNYDSLLFVKKYGNTYYDIFFGEEHQHSADFYHQLLEDSTLYKSIIEEYEDKQY